MIFQKYKNKLSYLLFEEIGGFHGFGMAPKQMKIKSCSINAFDPLSAPDARGCPQFTDEAQVSDTDIHEAIEYLNIVQPDELVAYSRGTSVLVHALGNAKLSYVPKKLYFIAPAWKRWGQNFDLGLATKNISQAQTRVVIGDCDAKVPVKHAKELADICGVGLEILLGYDHTLGKDLYDSGSAFFDSPNPASENPNIKIVNIIKTLGYNNPAKLDQPARIKSGALGFIWDALKGKTIAFSGSSLPEWGNKSYATPEQLIEQIKACNPNAKSIKETRLYKQPLARAIFS